MPRERGKRCAHIWPAALDATRYLPSGNQRSIHNRLQKSSSDGKRPLRDRVGAVPGQWGPVLTRSQRSPCPEGMSVEHSKISVQTAGGGRGATIRVLDRAYIDLTSPIGRGF